MKMNLKSKTVLLLAVVSVFLTVGSVFLCYTRYTNTMLAKYKGNAENLAETESLLLKEYDIEGMAQQTMQIYQQAVKEYGGIPNVDEMSEEEMTSYFARYDVVTQTPEYQSMLKTLQKMNGDNESLSLYFGMVDEENAVGVYLVDGANPDETVVCPCGYLSSFAGDSYAEIENGTYDFETVDTDYPEFGWICTAAHALISDSGEFIGISQVDISLEQIRQDRIEFLLRLILVMVVFSVLLTVVAVYVTNKSIVRPLNDLADAAASFVADRDSEDASKIETIDIKTGDEIEELYNSFIGMSHELTGYITDLMQITAEKEKLGVELDLAKKIQATYLPCIFPAFPERTEIDIYATMDPAKEVGGDFYDFFWIDHDHLGMVMADVSGKGVPAALFMMISKTLIKSYAQAGSTLDPSEILVHVNEQLCENNEAEMFVTVWLGIFTVSTGALISASAGHEYPAIRRVGEQFELIHDKHGLPLGGMPGVKYRNYETSLNKGDVLFVYTDGVPEATNAENELFGTDRMIDSLNSLEGDSCTELIDTVRKSIDDFVKEAPQFDDITMLCFRYNI